MPKKPRPRRPAPREPERLEAVWRAHVWRVLERPDDDGHVLTDPFTGPEDPRFQRRADRLQTAIGEAFSLVNLEAHDNDNLVHAYFGSPTLRGGPFPGRKPGSVGPLHQWVADRVNERRDEGGPVTFLWLQNTVTQAADEHDDDVVRHARDHKEADCLPTCVNRWHVEWADARGTLKTTSAKRLRAILHDVLQTSVTTG
jgi:hypothetical protein